MTCSDPMVAAVFRRRAELAKRQAERDAAQEAEATIRAEEIAARMLRLHLDRTMPPASIAVGLNLLRHLADRPGQPLPSREAIGTAMNLTPAAVAMAAYDLGRGGYLD